jgi:hypothetical protein
MPASDMPDFGLNNPASPQGRANLAEEATWYKNYLASRSPRQRMIENYLGNPGHSTDSGMSG